MRGPGAHGLAHGVGRGGRGVGVCVTAFGARAIFAGATIFPKTQILKIKGIILGSVSKSFEKRGENCPLIGGRESLDDPI